MEKAAEPQRALRSIMKHFLLEYLCGYTNRCYMVCEKIMNNEKDFCKIQKPLGPGDILGNTLHIVC